MDEFAEKMEDEKQKQAFLRVLASHCGNLYLACRTLGIALTQVEEWLETDKKFEADLKKQLITF
jgi:hypothetical protein